MRIVINKCFGGYSISPEAALWLFERGFSEEGFKTPASEYGNPEKDLKQWRDYLANKKDSFFLTVFTPDETEILSTCPQHRDHPLLIECVETLKEKSWGSSAKLQVIEIPDGVQWEIEEYDGQESVHEKHASWG